VDGNNNLFVTGQWGSLTNSLSYPVTNPGGGAYYDATFNGGTNGGDGFMAKFRPTPIIATAAATQPSCSNPCGGSATANVVSPSGCTYFYLWSNSQTTQTATGLCAGTYTVSIKNQLCSDTSLIVTINSNGSLTLNSTSTSASCGNNNGSATVTATGGTNPLTYSWSNGQTTSTATGLSAGTYTATVTDGIGCSNTQTVPITATGTLSVTVSTTQTGCTVNNGTATLNPNTGTAPYFYNWNNGQTTQTATGLASGNYTATITDVSGCTKTETLTITQSPAITVSVTTNTAACLSSNGDATANPSGGTPGFTYSWNNGQTTQTATGLAAGTYTATVTDANGCTQIQTASVNQVPGSTATASASPSVIISGASSALTATGGGTYVWSPTLNLSCTTCSNPTATPSQTTSYCVLVTDNNGCKDSTCITITVDIPCGTIYIPNAFSPNNDSENDLECVFGNCIETFHIAIYNRWGEKVFESTDQTICWDGTHRGQELNTAVFDYYLDAKLTTGEKIKKKGNISLLR